MNTLIHNISIANRNLDLAFEAMKKTASNDDLRNLIDMAVEYKKAKSKLNQAGLTVVTESKELCSACM